MLPVPRDGLRSGDVFVPGSGRYDNPAACLFKPAQWDTHRVSCPEFRSGQLVCFQAAL